MERSEIERINCLARKKKTEGLTPAEAEEQAALRAEYLREIRINLRAALDGIEFKEAEE